ncbi:MAG: DUF423 domain-containing protein [Crocinitomicaceae bacterium]|nr:DUF423 domain-containing protein [Crocinitomicaceae bacterium]
MKHKKSLIGATICIISGICLGAIGAHSLEPILSKTALESFKTGVNYQIYHGLSILILFLLAEQLKTNLIWSIRFMFIGIICFSGSIYLLALKSLIGLESLTSILGPVTPIGGLSLIIAWVIFLVVLLRLKK